MPVLPTLYATGEPMRGKNGSYIMNNGSTL